MIYKIKIIKSKGLYKKRIFDESFLRFILLISNANKIVFKGGEEGLYLQSTLTFW